ncbi:MAG: anti-sigma factor [Pseudomonadota bacterium]
MNLLRHPELIDRLASAYALGTLRGGARRRFEAIARQHPSVKAKVIVWQERFAGMTELQADRVPDANVWKRIENLLHVQPQAAAPPRAAASTGVSEGVAERLRRHLAWWRGGAIAGVVASVLVASVGLRLAGETDALRTELAAANVAMRYVAVLSDDRQAASMLVTFDPRKGMLMVKRMGTYAEAPGHSLELWALPPGAAPRSLGVVPQGTVMHMPTPEDMIRGMQALAVTLEPRGGAPAGGGPTGPVLFKGPLLEAPV